MREETRVPPTPDLIRGRKRQGRSEAPSGFARGAGRVWPSPFKEKTLRRAFAWLLVLTVPLWLAAQQMATFTYTLKNRDVRSVLARVTEELGPKGQVQADTESNRLTIRDDSQRTARIEKLLRDMDQPARRFALGSRLDVLARPEQNGIFSPTPGFVDMTQWARGLQVKESYEGVLDLAEGQSGSCVLGKSYRMDARAEGYDPAKRRLGLSNLALSKVEPGKPDLPVLQGAAVLPEGDPTVLLVKPTEKIPPLRLRVMPTLLPSVVQREVR